jgi:acetolactate synthase-1/2/3 large subunit
VAEHDAVGEPLPVNTPVDPAPDPGQVRRAAHLLAEAEHVVVLAGPGVGRDDASDALVRFSERFALPVATTFLGKGVFPDSHANALGTIGFMVKDYANFGFDRADVVVAVGYDLVEYPPSRWNPHRDKKILHIHRTVAEVDASYTLAVGVQGDISETLDAIAAASSDLGIRGGVPPVRDLVKDELVRGRADDSFPMAPARIVADIRTAMGEDDIVLCDTGAVKMWMARLYPTYRPRTCLVSNGLATMAFSIPGAFAAKLAFPERRVLAALGDGAFLMSTSELETAVREGVHFTALVWVDGGFGLIGWKQDIEYGRQDAVSFGNPDFVLLAESFGAKGYRIESAGDLLPTLEKALGDEAVSIIACPVDYAENAMLIERLGALTEPI